MSPKVLKTYPLFHLHLEYFSYLAQRNRILLNAYYLLQKLLESLHIGNISRMLCGYSIDKAVEGYRSL